MESDSQISKSKRRREKKKLQKAEGVDASAKTIEASSRGAVTVTKRNNAVSEPHSKSEALNAILK